MDDSTRPAGAKAQIRSAVVAARNRLAPAERLRRSRAITDRVVAMASFREAACVMAYCSFGSELDTAAFLDAVLAEGKTLALPKIDRARNRLGVYAVRDFYTQTVAGVWGIREPDPRVCAAVEPRDLDFVLVPGVAFDRRGGRIGYGKGYYDRLLEECRNGGGNPHRVAGAFETQLVDHVPMEHHDVPIEIVATESQTLFCLDGD